MLVSTAPPSSAYSRERALLVRSFALCLAITACGCALANATQTASSPKDIRPSSHLVEGSFLLQDYEQKVLFPWLVDRKYRSATPDKRIRDTGPFIELNSYGTHPAVRIYYSHEVISWLEKGRRGEVPDGAFIVKEMFRSPAAIYEELEDHPFLAEKPERYQRLLDELLTSWVVMIKDSKGGSVDGWFWGGLSAPPHRNCLSDPQENKTEACENWLAAASDDYSHVFYSGFGLGTCIRCHASAAGESTFSDLRNIAGFDSDEAPLQYRVDNSWRSPRYLGAYRQEAQTPADKAAVPADKSLLCGYQEERPAKPKVPREVVPFFDILRSFLLAEDDPDPCALVRKLIIAPELRPFDGTYQERRAHAHTPGHKPTTIPERRKEPNPAFVREFQLPDTVHQAAFTLPMQWSEHVYPGPGGPGSTPKSHDQYITSNNCIGCHGGLGGPPYPLSMFVQTGAKTGEGYDISPYNEWRWSPMGLAGRDPIFHAQLESELIRLRKDGGEFSRTAKRKTAASEDGCDPLCAPVEATQKALINVCLSCHGAMGQRQLDIDQAETCDDNPACDFNPDYYFLTEALNEEQLGKWTSQNKLPKPYSDSTPAPVYQYSEPGDFYGHHKYGELAREGISCAVCHHIAAPGSTEAGRKALDKFVKKYADADWLPRYRGQPIWTDNFIYFLANNTTGQYETGPADEIYGPFADVLEKPMQASLGITPRAAPPMADKLNNVFAWRRATRDAQAPTYFTADSNMCGTCHTINLPNVGLHVKKDCDPLSELDCNPILTDVEQNPAFERYTHSIEQATFLEWINSDFGPGMFNTRGPEFKSCQDCHMPNRLTLYEDKFLLDPGVSPEQLAQAKPSVQVDPLVSQIATIQDTTYPQSDNALPPEEISVPLRDTYRRHELVGLNAFVIEMARQFQDILGIDPVAYETGAEYGAELAIDSILLSAREQRVVSLHIEPLTVEGGQLIADVEVINKTGHRFPSGVAFRRAWIELAVYGGDRRELLWVSGRTNDAGLITDKEGRVLDTELLDKPGPNKLAKFQEHWQIIDSDDKVQIYEELITDAEGEFTTSFIHRVHHIKDNRLLPKGWVDANTFAGYNSLADTDPRNIEPQGQVLLQFFKAADPDGESVTADPDYRPGKNADGFLVPSDGADRLRYVIPCSRLRGCNQRLWVKGTVYFQATPPSWLNQRFRLAREAKRHGFATPATDRLYYFMSHLELSGGPLEQYKLPLVSKEVQLAGDQ